MDAIYIENLPALLTDLPADSIVSRTLQNDEHLKVILFGFAPGQELSEHTSAHAAALFFLSGNARLSLGDQTMEVGAGAWASMPPNLPHSILAHDEVRMLLLMVKG